MRGRLRGFVLESADDVFVLALPEPSAPSGELSPAERAVASLAVAGLSNAEIATRRGTSARTIAAQLGKIYRKLGVSSRVELVCALVR